MITSPTFIEHFIPAEDGLMLYVRDYGSDNPVAANAPPVVCLAGLSRNSRDFHPLALHLSTSISPPRRVIAMDYRGRGLSERDPDSSHYNLAIEAADVVHICGKLGIEKADFIGTSRGGLILHLLGASHPMLLNRIVLNDIGPVIELAGLLHIRDYLTGPKLFSTWDEVSDSLKTVHGAAFPALASGDWDEMAHALYRRQGDYIVADYDPALAETLKSLSADTPVADIWSLFDGLKPFPLLIIRGENSTILSIETAKDMMNRHPKAALFLAAGQGHAPLLHADGPREAITSFLKMRA